MTIRRAGVGQAGLSSRGSDPVVRATIDFHGDLVSGYLRGKRVLVFGAGVVASRLATDLWLHSPGSVFLADRSSGCALLFASSGRHMRSAHANWEPLGRGAGTLGELVLRVRPDVIFDLATCPPTGEGACATALAGAGGVLADIVSVLGASCQSGVSVLVHASIGWGASSESGAGQVARQAEQLVAWAAEQTGGAFVSVRLGRIVAALSDEDLLRREQPILAQRECRPRPAMSLSEASQLLILAGGIGEPGESLVLDVPAVGSSRDERVAGRACPGQAALEVAPPEPNRVLGPAEVVCRRIHPWVAHPKVPPLSPISIGVRAATEV